MNVMHILWTVSPLRMSVSRGFVIVRIAGIGVATITIIYISVDLSKCHIEATMNIPPSFPAFFISFLYSFELLGKSSLEKIHQTIAFGRYTYTHMITIRYREDYYIFRWIRCYYPLTRHQFPQHIKSLANCSSLYYTFSAFRVDEFHWRSLGIVLCVFEKEKTQNYLGLRGQRPLHMHTLAAPSQ